MDAETLATLRHPFQYYLPHRSYTVVVDQRSLQLKFSVWNEKWGYGSAQTNLPTIFKIFDLDRPFSIESKQTEFE